jgi:hypothetical protein
MRLSARKIINCDGYINLADVVKVRKARLGASPADAELEEGSDVDFDDDVDDSMRNDGATNDIDLERTLELVMKNGLIIRLQVCKFILFAVRSLLTSFLGRRQSSSKRVDTTSTRPCEVLEASYRIRHRALQIDAWPQP